MKRIALLFVFVVCAATISQAEDKYSFKGTVIRMEMRDCVVAGFRAAMSGAPGSVGHCPEYTVMTPSVLYVMVARQTEGFIPLAEDVEFKVIKNEVLAGEKSKSRFVIQKMMLRSDWEREQERDELMVRAMERSVNYELRNPPRSAKLGANSPK